MLRIFTILAILLTLALGPMGCKKESEPPAKTAEEYKEEADKQINEENAEKELSNIEKEIQAETAE